jgi:hypothetical protein
MKSTQRILSSAIAAFFATFSLAAQAEEGTLFMQDKNCGVAELKCGGIRVRSWNWGGSLPAPTSYANAARTRAPQNSSPGSGAGLLAIATASGTTCVAGSNYASATFMLNRQTYKLSEVTIAACNDAGMSLRYKTIKTLTPREMRETINANSGN